MLKDTTAFWTWFKEQQHKYRNIHEQDSHTINLLLDDIIAELRKYSEGLFVEIGGRGEPFELIITPQGIQQYFSDAAYLVLHAPPLEGWQFFALKPPHGMDFNFRMGDMELLADALYFKPLVDHEDQDKIGVCVLHKDYQTGDKERQHALINGLYHCLDTVLGEQSVTLDIDFLEFDTLPQRVAEDGILSIRALAGYIDWRKKERDSYEVRTPADSSTLLQGEIEGKPVLVMVAKNYKYYHYTEDYPYLLKVAILFNGVQENGLPAESMETIYALEDRLIALIGTDGHHVVSETHDGKRTAFCYIASLDQAKSIATTMQEQTDTHRLDYTIDYDKYWVDIKSYLQ